VLAMVWYDMSASGAQVGSNQARPAYVRETSTFLQPYGFQLPTDLHASICSFKRSVNSGINQ
jgi:hypothetical protein